MLKFVGFILIALGTLVSDNMFAQRSTSDFVFTINGNSYTLFVNPNTVSIDIDWEDDGIYFLQVGENSRKFIVRH
jgi:hypothetical protein